MAVNLQQKFVVLPPAGAQNVILSVDKRKPCRRRKQEYQSSFGAPISAPKNFFLCTVPFVSTDHRLAHTAPGAPGI